MARKKQAPQADNRCKLAVIWDNIRAAYLVATKAAKQFCTELNKALDELLNGDK
jgi:hypothetical protein